MLGTSRILGQDESQDFLENGNSEDGQVSFPKKSSDRDASRLDKKDSKSLKKSMAFDNRDYGILDPRIKLLLLLTVPTFLLSGAGFGDLKPLMVAFSVLPFMLLALSKDYVTTLVALVPYALLQGGYFFGHLESGSTFYNIFLLLYNLFCLLVPCGILGTFILRTTTVSEFISGMAKLGIPSFITIPCSVMFRFFPTIKEEYSAIERAMTMRGIRVSNVGLTDFIEYRIVPALMIIMIIGNDLTIASLTKGLTTHGKRSCIHNLKFKFLDYLLGIFCIGALLLLVMDLCRIKPW